MTPLDWWLAFAVGLTTGAAVGAWAMEWVITHSRGR